jgi:hypothetical protein
MLTSHSMSLHSVPSRLMIIDVGRVVRPPSTLFLHALLNSLGFHIDKDTIGYEVVIEERVPPNALEVCIECIKQALTELIATLTDLEGNNRHLRTCIYDMHRSTASSPFKLFPPLPPAFFLDFGPRFSLQTSRGRYGGSQFDTCSSSGDLHLLCDICIVLF